MKKSVKIWVVLAVIAIAVSYSLSCRNDVFVKPPPSLIGTYTGIYRYTEDNGATLQVNDSQYINVIINSNYLQMYLNEDLTPNVDRIACDAKAFYNIEGSVNVSYSDNPVDGTSRNLTAQNCAPERSPEGMFGLQQPGDSVILINQSSSSAGGPTVVTRKALYLKRNL